MTTRQDAAKWDGHTHTAFCRHGASEELDAYLTRAVQLGFTRYTVTEHPPLPPHWLEAEDVMQTLAMDAHELPLYLQAVAQARTAWSGRIEVRTGLELDYLPGQEAFTHSLIDACEDKLMEALISVHFLPGRGGMRCVDLTAEDFVEGLVQHYGGVDAVVSTYFDHVEAAVRFAGQLGLSTRVGHLTLIEKFRLDVPSFDDELIRERLERLLPLLADTGVGIDVNVAGLRRPSCQRAYVPRAIVQRAVELGIAVVYGSDAHRPEDVGANYDWFIEAGGKAYAGG